MSVQHHVTDASHVTGEDNAIGQFDCLHISHILVAILNMVAALESLVFVLLKNRRASYIVTLVDHYQNINPLFLDMHGVEDFVSIYISYLGEIKGILTNTHNL